MYHLISFCQLTLNLSVSRTFYATIRNDQQYQVIVGIILHVFCNRLYVIDHRRKPCWIRQWDCKKRKQTLFTFSFLINGKTSIYYVYLLIIRLILSKKRTMFQAAIISVNDSFNSVAIRIPRVSIERKAMTCSTIDHSSKPQGKKALFYKIKNISRFLLDRCLLELYSCKSSNCHIGNLYLDHNLEKFLRLFLLPQYMGSRQLCVHQCNEENLDQSVCHCFG